MELRQLRAFVAVASLGHFGQAAERLNVTQPALTQRIQTLERELGVQLLERTPREVRLTSAGEVLLPHARKLVQMDDEALRALKDYRAGVRGNLRIAYLGAGDSSLAGAIIAEYRRRFPAVELEMAAGSSGPNLQRLVDHSADAAFALVLSDRPSGIAARTIRREEVIVALSGDHPLAGLDPIPVKSLRGVGLGMPPAAVNPELLAALTRWVELRTGGKIKVVSEEPTDLAVETLARSGRAVVLAVRRYVRVPPSDGVVYRSLTPAPFVDLALAYREEDLSATLANLVHVVDDLAPAGQFTLAKGGELI